MLSVTTVDAERDRQTLPSVCFRATREGPEAQLVEQFLTDARLRVFEDCRVTIFKELRLSTSYPDVVLVAWKDSVTRTWHPERKNLKPHDLRLLHHLVGRKCQTEAELLPVFGVGTGASLVNLQR